MESPSRVSLSLCSSPRHRSSVESLASSSAAGSVATGWSPAGCSPRTATPTAQSPRRLGQTFESRFGSLSVFNPEPTSPTSATTPTPRSAKRSGVTNFTSPTNPFNRSSQKKSSQLEEARQDQGRAGARTRNAAVLPLEARGDRSGDQVPSMFSPDFKVGKSAPVCPASGARAHRGFSSHAMAEVLSSAAAGGSPVHTRQQNQNPALANYLNDMKRSNRGRRGPPAEAHQSLMGETGDVFSTRHGAVRRAVSADLSSSRRSPSVGSDFSGDECGSSRYRPWRRQAAEHPRGATPVLLHHINLGEGTASVATPTPHSERLRKGERRFEEVVTHMRRSSSQIRAQTEAHRMRNQGSPRLLHSEQVAKYEV